MTKSKKFHSFAKMNEQATNMVARADADFKYVERPAEFRAGFFALYNWALNNRQGDRVDVAALTRKANEFLSTKSPQFSASWRKGVDAAVHTALMETGNYHGFNYVEWSDEGGFERWRAAGQPTDNASYLGDQSRVFYYLSA